MTKKGKKDLAYILNGLVLLIGLWIFFKLSLEWYYFFGILFLAAFMNPLVNILVPEKQAKKTKPKVANRKTTNNKPSSKKLSDKKLLTTNIDDLSGEDFEELMYLYFQDKGFKPQRTPKTGDHGVDLVITDPKDGYKIAVQCKRYKENIGNDPIIKLDGGKKFYGCHSSLCITTSNYTQKAKEFAEKCKVDLWNGLHVQDKMSKWKKQKIKSIS